MSNSHERFYTWRRQFITTYSLMYKLLYSDIDDRHQSKYSWFIRISYWIIIYSFSFIIDTSSGQVIDIDFGSSFNAATLVVIKIL